MQYCLILITIVFTTMIGCGENLFKDISKPTSDHHYIIKARELVNNDNFSAAQSTLDKVENRNEEVHLLQAIIYLGASGFSLWKILLNTADQLTNSTSGSSGIESVFNALSGTNSVFGNGSERTERLRALGNAISYLNTNNTISSSRMTNMRCILTGILLLPTSSDTTTSLDQAISAMNNLTTDLATSGASCPNLTPLDIAMDSLSLVQANLLLVANTSQGCELLDFLTDSGALDEITTKLTNLTTNADKGCLRTDCGTSVLCQALDIPCVQESLDVSLAVAGDGIIHRCELMQNCTSGSTCF